MLLFMLTSKVYLFKLQFIAIFVSSMGINTTVMYNQIAFMMHLFYAIDINIFWLSSSIDVIEEHSIFLQHCMLLNIATYK